MTQRYSEIFFEVAYLSIIVVVTRISFCPPFLKANHSQGFPRNTLLVLLCSFFILVENYVIDHVLLSSFLLKTIKY